MSKNLETLVGKAAAYALLDRFGDVRVLAECEPEEYMTVPGIGEVRARQIQAAFGLAREVLVPEPKPIIRTAQDASAHMQLDKMRLLAYEELHALYLDRRNRPLAVRVLTRGSDAYTVVDPRQVYRVAVRLGAAAVILAHNHPSGDATPSVQDVDVTRRVVQAGRVLGVKLLDHFVVGSWTVSMAEEGLVDSSYEQQPIVM